MEELLGLWLLPHHPHRNTASSHSCTCCWSNVKAVMAQLTWTILACYTFCSIIWNQKHLSFFSFTGIVVQTRWSLGTKCASLMQYEDASIMVCRRVPSRQTLRKLNQLRTECNQLSQVTIREKEDKTHFHLNTIKHYRDLSIDTHFDLYTVAHELAHQRRKSFLVYLNCWKIKYFLPSIIANIWEASADQHGWLAIDHQNNTGLPTMFSWLGIQVCTTWIQQQEERFHRRLQEEENYGSKFPSCVASPCHHAWSTACKKRKPTQVELFTLHVETWSKGMTVALPWKVIAWHIYYSGARISIWNVFGLHVYYSICYIL